MFPDMFCYTVPHVHTLVSVLVVTLRTLFPTHTYILRQAPYLLLCVFFLPSSESAVLNDDDTYCSKCRLNNVFKRPSLVVSYSTAGLVKGRPSMCLSGVPYRDGQTENQSSAHSTVPSVQGQENPHNTAEEKKCNDRNPTTEGEGGSISLQQQEKKKRTLEQKEMQILALAGIEPASGRCCRLPSGSIHNDTCYHYTTEPLRKAWIRSQ